jgi:hypothetical protein
MLSHQNVVSPGRGLLSAVDLDTLPAMGLFSYTFFPFFAVHDQLRPCYGLLGSFAGRALRLRFSEAADCPRSTAYRLLRAPFADSWR